MKKKGFTLIELLGVIVVLAIIALIAVPTIIGVIDKSRKNSLRNSGYGLVESGILYYAEKQNSKTIRFDIKDNEIITKEKLNYKGSIKEGTVLVSNKGKVVVCINDGKYAAYKNFDDNEVTIVDNKTCTIPENSSIVYLDNVTTMDVDVNDLLKKINNLEVEVNSLKEEKANEIDITNRINNLTNSHNSDMSNINSRLDSLFSSLDIISNRLNNKVHYVESHKKENITTELSLTSLSVSIPENSYFCLTAYLFWNESAPKAIFISPGSSINLDASGNFVSEGTYPLISTTLCDYTINASIYSVWAQSYYSALNDVGIKGFYIH